MGMPKPPLVNFIGIGAQKCASSWVHEVLSEHPQSCLSTPKELDYFSYFWGRGHDWYERHFAPGAQARAVGDNSPSYFVHPLAPARASRYNPALRIVLALRDPIERAYSNHLHMVREGFIRGDDLSFEYGMSRNEMYVEQSRYATHLKRWMAHFPAEQFCVVLQEDLVTDAAATCGRLYRFLGLDEGFQAAGMARRSNESKATRHPRFDRALKASAATARRMGLGAAVSSVTSNEFVRRLRRRGQINLRQLVPPMTASCRAQLHSALAGEVNELRRLLGRAALPWPAFEEGRDQASPATPEDGSPAVAPDVATAPRGPTGPGSAA